MKIAPIIDAIKVAQIKGENIEYRLVHTGQHYDKNMSGSFFEQLGIPLPDINLEAGGGSQAEQTAKIMIGYESLLQKESTDYCLVVGDVTSTMACSRASTVDMPISLLMRMAVLGPMPGTSTRARMPSGNSPCSSWKYSNRPVPTSSCILLEMADPIPGIFRRSSSSLTRGASSAGPCPNRAWRLRAWTAPSTEGPKLHILYVQLDLGKNLISKKECRIFINSNHRNKHNQLCLLYTGIVGGVNMLLQHRLRHEGWVR